METLFVALRVVVALAAVLALLWVVQRKVTRGGAKKGALAGRFGAPKRAIQVLGSHRLSPKASIAVFTMRFAASQSATLSVLATASPPCARISSTTFCAGPALAPSPATEVPRSLTTTRAPWAAKASAKSRPMPPPAPVTRTTLS